MTQIVHIDRTEISSQFFVNVADLASMTVYEDRLSDVLLHRVDLPHVYAFPAARPLAKQTNLEIFILFFTTSACFFEVSQFIQIVGRLEYEPLDDVPATLVFELAIEPVFLIIQILVNLIEQFSEFLWKLIPVFVDFSLKGHIAKIIDNQKFQLVAMIMKDRR